MNRRLFLLALAGLLTLGLFGCSQPADSGGEASGDSNTTAKSDGEKLRIGVSIPAGDHGWTGGVVWWAEQMKEEFPNAEIIVQTATDGSEQFNKIETMTTQGLDGLVVLSFEPGPVTPAVEKAKKEGVYIVSVDRGLTKPIADVWMRGDNKVFGEKAADFMGEKLGGKGKIICLQGVICDVNTDRVNGFEQTLKAKYPGVQIMASEVANWNREEAYKVTQTLLTKYPDVQAIWAADDDMAMGAEQALKEAKMSNVWLVGGGGMKDVVKRVMDGDAQFPATVTYSPQMIADGIRRCIKDLEAGKKSSGTQLDEVIPVEIVIPTNAKDYYYPDSIY